MIFELIKKNMEKLFEDSLNNFFLQNQMNEGLAPNWARKKQKDTSGAHLNFMISY